MVFALVHNGSSGWQRNSPKTSASVASRTRTCPGRSAPEPRSPSPRPIARGRCHLHSITATHARGKVSRAERAPDEHECDSASRRRRPSLAGTRGSGHEVTSSDRHSAAPGRGLLDHHACWLLGYPAYGRHRLRRTAPTPIHTWTGDQSGEDVWLGGQRAARRRRRRCDGCHHRRAVPRHRSRRERRPRRRALRPVRRRPALLLRSARRAARLRDRRRRRRGRRRRARRRHRRAPGRAVVYRNRARALDMPTSGRAQPVRGCSPSAARRPARISAQRSGRPATSTATAMPTSW